jgi:hypothetical protein
MNGHFDNDIPAPTRRPGPAGMYRFGEMAVGQSFAVPAVTSEDAKKRVINLRVCALQWAKRAKSSAKFTVAVRNDDPAGALVVRVWRIA